MKIKKGFVVRKVGDGFVVVPVGAMSKNFHGMINLNSTGNFLWNFYTEEHSIDDGVAAIRAEYEIDEEIARRDVERFAKFVLENEFAEN